MTPPECPYCDKLRRHDSSGRLLATCGNDPCHRLAIADTISAKAMDYTTWPRRTGDIDFGNGFAAHNLRFRLARERVVS